MPKIIKYQLNGNTVFSTITDEALSISPLAEIAAILVPQGQAWQEVDAVERSMTERREEVWGRVKSKRAAIEYGGVHVSGHWFQTDQESLDKLASNKTDAKFMRADGAADSEQMTANGGPLMWKTAENGLVPMTVGLAIAIADAVRDHVAATYTRAEILRAQIYASDDPESIDISSGWPAVYEG